MNMSIFRQRSLAKKTVLLPMLSLIAGCTALTAQDKDAATPPQHRGGVHISLLTSASTPDFPISAYDGTIWTSDIGSSSGFAVGLFWEMPLGSKYVYGRLTFDYGTLGGKKIDYLLYSKNYGMNQIDLMYDIQLHLHKSGRVYIFGGLGYYNRSISDNLWGHRMRSYDVTSGNCRNYGCGAYIWKHVGFEFRRVICDDPWTQLSLTFRT